MTRGSGGRRPVTVIGGFLGSGKTTLLRRFLAEDGGRDIAVVVNEFGEVPIDHHLLWRAAEQSVVVSGGCVCCSRREDLVRNLKELLDQDERGTIPRLRRVLIETSGLADPAPILFTLVTDSVLQHHFFVDGMVATVDAVSGELQLDLHEESRKQATVADQLILTKVDMAEPAALERLAARLRALNPTAEITRSVFGKLQEDCLFSESEGARVRIPPHGTWDQPPTHGLPASETNSLSLTFRQPVDWIAFTIWLTMLLHARGESVLRVKGLIHAQGVGGVILNGVQHVLHPPLHLDRWPAEDASSRLVFITRKLDPASLLRSLNAFQRLGGTGSSGVATHPAARLESAFSQSQKVTHGDP